MHSVALCVCQIYHFLLKVRSLHVDQLSFAGWRLYVLHDKACCCVCYCMTISPAKRTCVNEAYKFPCSLRLCRSQRGSLTSCMQEVTKEVRDRKRVG
jgi:hypothetical protein